MEKTPPFRPNFHFEEDKQIKTTSISSEEMKTYRQDIYDKNFRELTGTQTDHQLVNQWIENILDLAIGNEIRNFDFEAGENLTKEDKWQMLADKYMGYIEDLGPSNAYVLFSRCFKISQQLYKYYDNIKSKEEGTNLEKYKSNTFESCEFFAYLSKNVREKYNIDISSDNFHIETKFVTRLENEIPIKLSQKIKSKPDQTSNLSKNVFIWISTKVPVVGGVIKSGVINIGKKIYDFTIGKYFEKMDENEDSSSKIDSENKEESKHPELLPQLIPLNSHVQKIKDETNHLISADELDAFFNELQNVDNNDKKTVIQTLDLTLMVLKKINKTNLGSLEEKNMRILIQLFEKGVKLNKFNIDSIIFSCIQKVKLETLETKTIIATFIRDWFTNKDFINNPPIYDDLYEDIRKFYKDITFVEEESQDSSEDDIYTNKKILQKHGLDKDRTNQLELNLRNRIENESNLDSLDKLIKIYHKELLNLISSGQFSSGQFDKVFEVMTILKEKKITNKKVFISTLLLCKDALEIRSKHFEKLPLKKDYIDSVIELLEQGKKLKSSTVNEIILECITSPPLNENKLKRLID